MVPHPDDMGLDDYDKTLVADSDYSRPHYDSVVAEPPKEIENGPCHRCGNTTPLVQPLADDIAHASAALLVIVLPKLMTCEPAEMHRRLTAFFKTTISSYFEAFHGSWGHSNSCSDTLAAD